MTTRDARAQYAAARNAAGILDRRADGVVEATGRDRASFLNALLSNDVKSLAAGQGCAATLLDVHGKVQFVVLVWALEDRMLVVTPPATAGAVLDALDKYLFSEKVVLRDASDEWALAMLLGPAAPSIAEQLTGQAPAATPWAHVPAKVDGIDVRLVRGGGETGLPEVWLMVPAAEFERAWKAALAAGAMPIDTDAYESLRVEAGTPSFPRDIGPSVLLPEVPFANLVSPTKGCYPGQEVVVRIRDRGHVNRHLRGLVLQGDAVPPAGSEIVGGEAVVGTVTSATRSLGLDRPIALALVRRTHAEPGTAVGVRIGGAVVPATVSLLPFSR